MDDKTIQPAVPQQEAQTIETQATDANATAEVQPRHKRSAWWTIVAILLTLIAWALVVCGWVWSSIICAALAVVCAVVGLRSQLRHWAVTMIIAAGVLLLVFAIFEVAILYILQ